MHSRGSIGAVGRQVLDYFPWHIAMNDCLDDNKCNAISSSKYLLHLRPPHPPASVWLALSLSLLSLAGPKLALTRQAPSRPIPNRLLTLQQAPPSLAPSCCCSSSNSVPLSCSSSFPLIPHPTQPPPSLCPSSSSSSSSPAFFFPIPLSLSLLVQILPLSSSVQFGCSLASILSSRPLVGPSLTPY